MLRCGLVDGCILWKGDNAGAQASKFRESSSLREALVDSHYTFFVRKEDIIEGSSSRKPEFVAFVGAQQC